MSNTVQFGWEVSNMLNGGVDMFVKVEKAINLEAIEVDVSMGFLKTTIGFSEVLCNAMVTPSLPTFVSGAPAYEGNQAANPDFSGGTFYNPDNFSVGGGFSAAAFLFAAILKAEAPATTNRNMVIPLDGIAVPAGSYIVFHMDGAGVVCDVEMQGIIKYSLA